VAVTVLQDLFADLRRGTGAEIIASSSGVEVAREPNVFGGGIFTHAVLEGLKGPADADSDGRVTTSELRAYVMGQVDVLSTGLQRPSVRAENTAMDFALSMKG
jgi:uncharacterized caspase-like protein